MMKVDIRSICIDSVSAAGSVNIGSTLNLKGQMPIPSPSEPEPTPVPSIVQPFQYTPDPTPISPITEGNRPLLFIDHNM